MSMAVVDSFLDWETIINLKIVSSALLEKLTQFGAKLIPSSTGFFVRILKAYLSYMSYRLDIV